MTESSGQTRIEDREMLARFMVVPYWLRADGTVRQEAFVPFPHPALSVDRHGMLLESELWARGERVAGLRKKTLIGRADVSAGQVRHPSAPTIEVVAAPLSEDPEHASIIGWPGERFGQKIIAQRIAASAKFFPVQSAEAI